MRKRRITTSMTGTTTIKPEMLFSHLDPEIEVGTYPLFRRFPEISHFVTLRGTVVPDDPFSSFNLGRHSGEDLSRVMKNRDRLCRALSLPSSALVQPRQVHGNEVLPLLPDFFSLTDEAQAEYLSQADGLVTALPGVCVAISTADCVPLLFYDPCRRVVGASHAGWRGTVGHIARKTVEAMHRVYGSDPRDIYAAIGPSIGRPAFQVGDEVVEAFREAYPGEVPVVSPCRDDEGRHHVDLWEANRADLLSSGIIGGHLSLAAICTYARNDLFFSSRRARGKNFGRFLSGIFLHNDE